MCRGAVWLRNAACGTGYGSMDSFTRGNARSDVNHGC
jgi:hypothetical protein